jgi:hypothetical protein
VVRMNQLHYFNPYLHLGSAAFNSQGTAMQKKTLTLKSSLRATQCPKDQPKQAETAQPVLAGRALKRQGLNKCQPLVNRLNELISSQSHVFIQMRHGTGYSGVAKHLESGWLTLSAGTIHGTKQKATTPNILIQIKDGSFIAHVHAVDPKTVNILHTSMGNSNDC